jgi:succinate dehydrogenase / fumarate reductase flavoprotein subunit
MWELCGMSRERHGLLKGIQTIQQLRDEFWRSACVPGAGSHLNMALEKAGRVADLLELGELLCRDALTRNESCGCHFREEFQTAEGAAQRNDEDFAHVAAWQFTGDHSEPIRHQEELVFEEVGLAERSYK